MRPHSETKTSNPVSFSSIVSMQRMENCMSTKHTWSRLMPVYNFRNTETNEIVEKIMKIAERDQWMIDNPTFEQYHSRAPVLGDPVRMGITKPPSDFQKEIIGRVQRMPGAHISTRFGIPKEY